MRSTKRLTLSAILVALGVAIMFVGVLVDTVSLSVAAICSLIVVFVYIEIGSPYPYLVWICTSLCAALMFTGSVIWLEYFLIFGIYPIIKAKLEKLARPWWLPLKFLIFNAEFWLLFLVMERILGVPMFESDALWLNAALYALSVVAFFAYDYFITFMVRIYFLRFRGRIARFLK
ncbi:MAG: hypothetical protein IJY65_02915 [Clostridia bacterium]|nr:hypothetical protein [Clostridia bacterium]